MNSFNFKLVNENQLINIVKQVKREKRRKRDDDERTTFLLKKEKRLSSIVNVDKVSSGENDINCQSADSPCKYRDSKNGVNKYHQKSNNGVHLPSTEISSEQMHSTYDQIKYSCVQCCSTDNLNTCSNEKVVTLMRNIQSLRERLVRSIDAFLLQHEQKLLKEKLFKKSNNKFEEIHSRKIMGCQYQILKLDYQLVLDMKQLNHCVAGHDILCLLKVLSKCHSTALKIFQVFLRGFPEILKIEKDKNKFCELLKGIVTLSNVCKFLRINIKEIKHLKDFLVDDLKKRCKSLLYTMEKKMFKETRDKLQRKMKTSTEWNMESDLYRPFQVSETTKNRIQTMPLNKIHISKKSLRKIAKKVFGAQEQSRTSCKDNGATKFEDGNFVRVIELPKVRNKNEEISKNQGLIHKIDDKNNLPSNIKLREGSNIDLGLNCISVGTQYSSLLENNVENFDVESFSKKLCAVLERELNNNFQNILQHLSKDQCHIKDAKKKDLQIEEEQESKNSDSVNTFINVDNTIFSEELFQARYKNENESSPKQHKEAFELDKDVAKAGEVFRKQSKENNTSNEEKNIEFRKTQNNTGNKQLSSRYCNVLPIGEEYSSNEQHSQHQFLQEINRDLKSNCKHKLCSFNSPSTEEYPRNLPNKNNTVCFDNEPWEIIGR